MTPSPFFALGSTPCAKQRTLKRKMTNPVTHVEGHLIWPGGHARKMTVKERVLWKLGKLKTVPRDEKFFVPYASKKSKSFGL